MVLELFENIFQLVAILAALLISIFRYIVSRNRTWIYSVVFFLSSLLSCYFWTAYLIIMGSTPNVSDMLAYFGWNTSYLVLLLLLIHIKSPQERRYFHILMLVPIPLNLWQLSLYITFGGVLNNIYQVTVCTLIACFCIQSILWHIRHRDISAPPHVHAAAFIYVTTEFGMWTCSCFDDPIGSLYYPCSFLNSLSCLLLVWAIMLSEKKDEVSGLNMDKRVQNILKSVYVNVTLVCALGGLMLGAWIRDVLSSGISGQADTSVYDIIPLILFLISLIIVAATVTVIFIVIFEQKVMENNSLREARKVAERSNAAKSEFLAHMSHEIRTPMNAVLGMNEMVLNESIRARDDLPEDREELHSIFSEIVSCSGNIESAGNSLLAIINDILDLSKIEAGKLEIREGQYRLSSVINDVGNMVCFRARAKDLDFLVDVDENLPDLLYGDEVRIRQVVTNVLNNAVKYTQEGSVTLSVKADGTEGYEKGQTIRLVFFIRDTGIGIKEEDMGRLFQSFERMDMKENSAIEGTGLGLAITRRLVGMMNGTIEVKSRYREGSEFILHIPQKVMSSETVGDCLRKTEDNSEKAYDGGDSFFAPAARVLIVDDTRMNLIVAAGLLKDTGMIIDTAGGGDEALELAAKSDYDLILLDQRMPVMDGIETLHILREREDREGKHTPVICLTADAIDGARDRYLKEGFTDYLTKPIEAKNLKKMVLKYLPEDKIQKG